MKFDFKTSGTCARTITLERQEEQVASVHFDGGCQGSAQGVAALVAGQSAVAIIERQQGTRCPDQLVMALAQALLREAS